MKNLLVSMAVLALITSPAAAHSTQKNKNKSTVTYSKKVTQKDIKRDKRHAVKAEIKRYLGGESKSLLGRRGIFEAVITPRL